MTRCRSRGGPGADQASDNVNWLPCRTCNGKGYLGPSPRVGTHPESGLGGVGGKGQTLPPDVFPPEAGSCR